MTNDNFQLDMQGLWDRLPTAFSAARGLKRFSGSPNWVVMKWLLGHGSTYSCQICRQLGLDPNAKMGRIEWGIPAPAPLSGITEREWISVDELRHVEARLLVLELLRRQGYAKGGYFNTCKSCGKEAWWMDKLAWTCLECAQHNVKDLLYSITNDPSEPPPFTPTQKGK